MKVRSKKLNFYSDRIEVRIEGFQIGKLLDAAAKSGMLLKAIRVDSKTAVRAEIAACDLKQLQKLAGARYRVTPQVRRGVVYQTRALLRRPMLVIGVLLAASMVIAESFCGAAVTIDGYRAIPESALRDCLAASGVREGVYRPGIDWGQAEAALFETFPQIMWVRLVYDGRLVVLEVAETGHQIIRGESELAADEEKLFIPAPEPQNGYCNIVAAHSGYIERIDPLWGDAMAEPGDYVKKGQILIRGQIPIETTTFDENAPKEYYVRARGEVWARVPYRLTFRQERYLRSAQVAREQAGAYAAQSGKTAQPGQVQSGDAQSGKVVQPGQAQIGDAQSGKAAQPGQVQSEDAQDGQTAQMQQTQSEDAQSGQAAQPEQAQREDAQSEDAQSGKAAQPGQTQTEDARAGKADASDMQGGPAVVSNRVEKTQEQAKAKVEQQIRIWAKENLPENAEIVKKSLNFTQKENIIEVGVTLEVRRQIGKEQEIVFGTEDSTQQRD